MINLTHSDMLAESTEGREAVIRNIYIIMPRPQTSTTPEIFLLFFLFRLIATINQLTILPLM